MRGKLRAADLFIGGLRITPACAGKTARVEHPRHIEEDHPRVCGENLFHKILIESPAGSPPRVRGKHSESTRRLCGTRITPACAGKTADHGFFPSGSKDHPRVCGENTVALQCALTASGSPPRVRGKPREKEKTKWQRRITPACAGKTSNHVMASSGARDHPRVCGENTSSNTLILLYRGSPPRVRGKPANKLKELKGFRITPACAGKTDC